jgi:hypothetical protein
LEVDPDLTGLELFERLQRQRPGVYPDGQLRTLQRRLKHWRMSMARSLIFGVHGGANKELLPPSAADRASTTKNRSTRQSGAISSFDPVTF